AQEVREPARRVRPRGARRARVRAARGERQEGKADSQGSPAHRYTTSHSVGQTRTTKYQRSCDAPNRERTKWPATSENQHQARSASATTAWSAWQPITR